ncbi:GSCFA domain-containing protein [Fulvivirga sp. M361]|uniref:GSCFA domain-containing protein n=1 Tax=Fulvivirga sp. M361 TaxID=2594266 RepID=UPI00117BBB1D|nr:GSCFA domain-containing protein [Fulvivirga sp. M361]TRX61712.1 GSCFA domain-containing protein [Fulvivirga sp. M361]
MFRTEINPAAAQKKINFSSSILTIGSCFSDAMGYRFRQNKFSVLVNPFGTAYNPISIIRLLEYALNKQTPPESGFVNTQGLWAHYDFHSQFSSPDKEELKSRILTALAQVHEFLKCADYLLITLGTAMVYEHETLNAIVSNCHKVPAREFSKSLLEEAKIIDAFKRLQEKLHAFNPSIKLILTVSPVRHLKETLELNMVSKSILRTACYKFIMQHENANYFPSYEIMIDDLRDYRFYKPDMLHPSDVAEDYIWSKFTAAYLDEETLQLIQKWSVVQKALNHRPFNIASEGHQKFIQHTIEQLLELSDKFDITEELNKLKAQLL